MKRKVKEHILMQVVRSMKVNGRMIREKEEVKRYQQMD